MNNTQISEKFAELEAEITALKTRNNVQGTAIDTLQRQRNDMGAALDEAIAENTRQADSIVVLTQAQARAAGGGGGFRGPPPRPSNLTFTNLPGEDWITFRKKFETLAETQRYDLQDSKNMLSMCMQGQAYITASRLDHRDANVTLQQLLNAYEAKFLPPSASAMAIQRYEQAVQGAHEDILDWHGRLDGLWARAYPAIPAGALLIRKFINGLRIKNVKQFVLRADPQTYDLALDQAQKEQCIQDQTAFGPGYNPAHHQVAVGHGNRGEPMEIGAIGEQKRCFTCNLFGHEKKDCKYMRKPTGPATAGGGGNRGPARPGGAGGPRPAPSKPPTTGANSTPMGRRFFKPKKYIAGIEGGEEAMDERQGEEQGDDYYDEDGNVYYEVDPGAPAGHEDAQPGGEAPEN